MQLAEGQAWGARGSVRSQPRLLGLPRGCSGSGCSASWGQAQDQRVHLYPGIPPSTLWPRQEGQAAPCLSVSQTPHCWCCRGGCGWGTGLAVNRACLRPNFPTCLLCSRGAVPFPLCASLSSSTDLSESPSAFLSDRRRSGRTMTAPTAHPCVPGVVPVR